MHTDPKERWQAIVGRWRRLAAVRGQARTALVVVLSVVLVATGLVVWSGWRKVHDVDRAGWNLIFSDEFDNDSLNYFTWNAQDVASPRNHEQQYYTPNNVSVRRGRLRLTSRREQFRDRQYTSAAVDTFGKFSFTYGRVEFRAELPQMGQGVWPALWMLGNGCNPVGSPCPWPTTGSNEIDVLEAVNDPSKMYVNAHYGTTPGRSQSEGPCPPDGRELSSGSHTFAVEWAQGGELTWLVDDEVACQRRVPGFFDAPMYLFLNTAIGGDWPGPASDSTPFPQHFDIDYVRVYQRA